LRSQVRAAMIFNGQSPDVIESIDEDTFAEICVMWADGIIGEKATYDSIAPLTTAIFNYIRAPSTPPYKPKQLFPWIAEYEENPDLEEDQAQNGLIAFLTSAPGFSMEKLNGRNNVVKS